MCYLIDQFRLKVFCQLLLLSISLQHSSSHHFSENNCPVVFADKPKHLAMVERASTACFPSDKCKIASNLYCNHSYKT